ncbi:histidine triad nucleotide-binding protein [Tumebacillus permanentifrigoris]|uniref:Histidine triad (HIT) family protein n=1 Tax=Tumebacillus permanentifrigoris TaxID=378543 RepID=A0A316DAY7_9BACL|nr:histidine triad nucleotide-binding protein [Tumebacillus permanentifrigoris]PWK10322.1 histidine triad (HIT) family protein [Tumebacillus permanentifrigoris]
MDCIFCKIIAGEIPSKKIYEDEHVYAFHDINPIAPSHALVIPKKHIRNVLEIAPEDSESLLKLHQAIGHVARELGIAEDGFRVITNTNEHGQQTVFHLHYHVIGGRQLQWNM